MLLKKQLKKIIASSMTLGIFGFGMAFMDTSSNVNIISKASAKQIQVSTPIVANVITSYIKENNTSISSAEAYNLANTVIMHSYSYGVDPLIMASLISAESHFYQSSYSGAGAIGLGQLMPDTAQALGVNPFDPSENILGACSYLSTQLNNFSSAESPMEFALAAYNAGPNAVKKYGGIPPYPETQAYVKNIKEKYYSLYKNLMMDINADPSAAFSGVSANNSNNVLGYTPKPVQKDDIRYKHLDNSNSINSTKTNNERVIKDYSYLRDRIKSERTNTVMYSTEDDFQY